MLAPTHAHGTKRTKEAPDLILRDYESNIGLIMKDGVIYKNTLSP